MGKALVLKKTKKTTWFTLPNNLDLVSIIDTDVFENYVMFDNSWYFKKTSKSDDYYVVSNVKTLTSTKTFYLHWIPIDRKNKSHVTDHIENNTLDNRSRKLRSISQSKNVLNSKRRKNRSKRLGCFRYFNCTVTMVRSEKANYYQAYFYKKYIGISKTKEGIMSKIKNKLKKQTNKE